MCLQRARMRGVRQRGVGPMAETRADPALYRKLWQQTRLYRPHLGALLALHVLSGALKLLAPLPLMIGVDCVLGSQPLPAPLNAVHAWIGGNPDTASLLLAASLLVAIAVLIQLVGLVTTLLSTYVGEKLVLGFRAALFRH